jgi:hypothetical protein
LPEVLRHIRPPRNRDVAFSPVRAITLPKSVMDGSSGIGHSVIAMAPSLNSLFPVGGNARNERGLAAIPLRVAQTAD